METESKILSEAFCVMDLPETKVYYKGLNSDEAIEAMNKSKELWAVHQHFKYVQRKDKYSLEVEESYWVREDVQESFEIHTRHRIQTGRRGMEHLVEFLSGLNQTP